MNLLNDLMFLMKGEYVDAEKNKKCENCNRCRDVYHVKKIDYTTPEKKETLHWWCMECVNINNRPRLRGFFF